MHCEIYALLIMLFVLGYAAGWYRYDVKLKKIPGVCVKVAPTEKVPVAETEHEPDHDHDDLIVNRLHK